MILIQLASGKRYDWEPKRINDVTLMGDRHTLLD